LQEKRPLKQILDASLEEVGKEAAQKPTAVEEVMQNMDKDIDGFLSFAEVTSRADMGKMEEKEKKMAENAFNTADSDKDGKLSVAELPVAIEEFRKKFESLSAAEVEDVENEQNAENSLQLKKSGDSKGLGKVKYDKKFIDVRKLPTLADFAKMGVSYVSGSSTYDTLRYARTGNFPLKVQFTDSTNGVWEVFITSETDELHLLFPCSRQIIWYGDERDRTGFDAQCNICKVNFYYQPSSWFNSHGIRLHAQCYALDELGYRVSGGYSEIMKDIQQGIDAATSIADLAAKIKGLR